MTSHPDVVTTLILTSQYSPLAHSFNSSISLVTNVKTFYHIDSVSYKYVYLDSRQGFLAQN